MKTLIVIGGPTASGKTDLAITVAKYFNTSILSADSRQCYRELHIGVAKPTDAQLSEVTHYFINSHSIHESVSAGVYERYGLETLNSLFDQHEFVVCVGGTGLYIRALCEGIDEMPAVNPETDLYVNQQYQLQGLPWLQQQMFETDPLFFETGEKHNPSRLLRALVFKLSTGKSILEFRTKNVRQRDFAIKYFSIDTDRDRLYARIHERVDRMISEGLVAEAESLLPYRQLKPLQTVGYTELFDFFDGKNSKERAIELIKQHTRNYAKRQLTWFRHQGNYTPVGTDYENIIQALKA